LSGDCLSTPNASPKGSVKFSGSRLLAIGQAARDSALRPCQVMVLTFADVTISTAPSVNPDARNQPA
jgi:hypothetical protein